MASLPKPEIKAVGPPGDPDFWTGFLSRLRSALATVGEQMEHPYENSPWVYAANQAIAIPISGLPFKIMREQRREGQRTTASVEDRINLIREVVPNISRRRAVTIASLERPRDRVRAIRKSAPWLPAYSVAQAATNVEVVESGPWVDLFINVNSQMTRSQLWEATLLYLGTDGGESFWELAGRGGPVELNEIPIEIWPRSGRNFKPLFDEDGTKIEKWRFESSFKGINAMTGKSRSRDIKHDFELHQLVHFHYFHPRNSVRGLAPLEPVREEIEQGFRATRFNTKFFENGATIGGLLNVKSDNMNSEEAQELKRNIESKHRGQDKAHRLLTVFGAEAEFKEMTSTQKDMQFVELQNQNRDVIMAVNRISKSALGLVEDQNRANLLASQKGVWETTLIPKAVYMEDLLDSDLFTPERTRDQPIFGMFDLSEVEALQENFGEKLEHAKKLMEMSYPVNSIAERLELGMESLEWGNIGYRPTSVVPVAQDSAEAEPEVEELGTRNRKIEFEDTPEKLTLSRVQQNELWEKMVEKVFEPGEILYKKQYREFVKGVRKAQLIKLGSVNDVSKVTVPEQMLFGLGDQQRALEERMEPVYRKTFDDAEADAVFEVAKLKGVTQQRQVDPSEKNAFIRLMNEEAKITVRTMRESLRNLFRQALEEDATMDELEKAVRAWFNHFTGGGKLGVIARTEVSTTVNAARHMTFDSLDIDQHDWVTAGDEFVRSNHVSYGNAGTREVGFNWATVVGGDYTLQYPLDPQAPVGERANCRCVAVPA